MHLFNIQSTLFTLSPIIAVVYATPILNSVTTNTTSMELRGTILSYGDGNCNGGFGKRVYGENSLCVDIKGKRSISILDCTTAVTLFDGAGCRGSSRIQIVRGNECRAVDNVASVNVKCT